MVDTHFVRHRNVLLARADFSPLYVDYYLHLADYGIQHDAEQDRILRGALAAFTLHCASRPRNEHIAWTINFQDPLLNAFLVADNENCTLVGRLFTEDVKEGSINLFYADVIRGGQKRRSAVEFTGTDPFRAVEAFYSQSEQRPARYFQLGEEEFAMLSCHPDCDLDWYTRLDLEGVRQLAETETLARIERREYRWDCGCNQARMLEILAPTMRTDPERLFEGEESLLIHCPRCGARHRVTREALEAYVARST